MNDITIHPAADLFPMMDDESFAELVNDIREQGQHEPVVLWRGSLIDGRNRLKACQQLGIEPDTHVVSDDIDPLRWVVSANLHRRHLTQSQKAMIAAKLLPLYEEEAKFRMLAGRARDRILVEGDSHPTAEMPEGDDPGEAREKAAAAVGVSPRLVSDAKAILKASPEVAAQVGRGEITVGAAKRATAENSEQPITAPPSPKAATKVAAKSPRQELTARAFDAYDKLLWAIDALRLRATCYASLAGIHSALEAGVSQSVRNKNGSERVTAASRKAAFAALGGLVRSLDQMGPQHPRSVGGPVDAT